MQILSAQLISNKKVLLRMDLDVPIEDGQVADDFRLEAGLNTLDFCLQHAKSVIIMGHLGRPPIVKIDPSLSLRTADKQAVLGFSVKPIVDWFEAKFAHVNLPEGKLHILENLRFEEGENIDPVSSHGTADEQAVLDFAKELATLADLGQAGTGVFINESFAAHHPAASTTVLPTLLPHGAGFRFAEEVKVLRAVRDQPQRPMVVIIGGAKLEDKLPAVLSLSHIADAILVGGKIALEMKLQGIEVPPNVMVGKLNEVGSDISQDTTASWTSLIAQAKAVVWNGPLGRIEDPQNNQTQKIAQLVIDSEARSILGGGDTVAYLGKLGLLEKFNFVSTGGGAMLELLEKGTLPTIEALR